MDTWQNDSRGCHPYDGASKSPHLFAHFLLLLCCRLDRAGWMAVSAALSGTGALCAKAHTHTRSTMPLSCSFSASASYGAKKAPCCSFITSQAKRCGRISASGVTSEEEDMEEERKSSNFQASQSSWTAKNREGEDYLYRLGKEADNMNITVGARRGLIDDLFVGDFLGKEADIVFAYRQKVTRSFEYIQGDYYISPIFMDMIVTHIVKNYLVEQLDSKVPLILGVWGGKGQGKSFQTELIFKAMNIEPVIMSAGELESDRAGEPGKLIRERYRTASQVAKIRGKLGCLMINDLDAGIGRFENTQMTVNNQIVVGTLMNLADNPTRVSIGQQWTESDIVNRIPIIVTGNDLSTIWAPLIRDGRMEKFYWQPTREDLVNIVYHMYHKDGIAKEDIAKIIDTFPNQALDFYGALKSRTYDQHILKWVKSIGGAEKLGEQLLRKKKSENLPPFSPPKQNIKDMVSAGWSLIKEQEMVMQMRLSDEYMKKQVGFGSALSFSS